MQSTKRAKQLMQIAVKTIELFLTIIEGILRFLLGIAESIVASSDDKKYKASFASSWSLLSPWNYGFNLTGNKKLSVKDSYQNSLVIASTGMGKTSVVMLPCLYSMKGSFCIHDPSGEIFLKSSGYLKSKGYEIKVLNFSKPEISCGYNPLARANSNSYIQKISSMLVENSLGGHGSKDPFWTNMAISLLTMLITILKTQDIQYQNLCNIRHLLNQMGGNPEAVDALFSLYADQILFAEYKSFIAYDEKVISGTIASCKAALNIFNDPAVAKVTSVDNLNMDEFREKPTALYIQNSVADQKYYSVLTSIFTEQFFSYVMSRFAQNGEQDIFFLIDEASSLKLPTLQLAVSNVRKHRAGIMLIIQSENQLTNLYGKPEAEAIKANCFAKMYFSGASLETAKELEQILGKYEYKDKEKSKVVRPLMESSEIRIMKANQALLICGHHAPIKATLIPYYKNLKYKNYPLIPPPVLSSSVPEILPILTLPKPNAEDKTEQSYLAVS
ncbi:MAG TPA: type IV secretory system conjugative DNA transfer family protein [Bacteroidia bacterium]|jgi:type IV secretion system protein VirD4|nr:type IV secretory system conjugative DNA transfer family protein [Bacteroidia bacterium]